MKSPLFCLLACLFLALTACAAPQQEAPPVAQSLPDIPSTFDSVGPVMRQFTNSQGRELVYIDEGQPGWQAVVFFGGSGTSAQAFHLVEFNRTLRENLKLRVISLERNGYGQTPFTPGLGFSDYANDLRELLDHLGVSQFTAISISGGGPYMSHVVDLMPERVSSLHYAVAASFPEAGQPSRLKRCAEIQANPAAFAAKAAGWVTNPMVWWNLGDNTSINHIPGFQDAANNEGAHCFFIRGQMGDAAALVHEYKLYCQPGPTEAPKTTAPLFLYYGEADTTVTMANAVYWQQRYAASPQTMRSYPGEGHDVQYRHWEQILLDMAGFGDQVLVCPTENNPDRAARLVSPDEAEDMIERRQAVLGSCAWD